MTHREQFLETPFYGSRQMRLHLRHRGIVVGRGALIRLLTTRWYGAEERNFQVLRGPITKQYQWNLVKGLCKTHQPTRILRRVLPTLMEIFGHATQGQPLIYLCIQP